MPSTDMITERLDALEANLPTIPAKVFHFQRAVAAKTYDNYTATMGAVAESYKSFFDTALTSSKTVTGQARAAGEQLVATLTNGIKTVAGQEKTRFRGVGRVGFAFTFTAVAYNLIRLPKLLAEAG